MAEDPISGVTTLTVDIFGTVLDLSGTLVPACEGFLEGRGAVVDGAALWTLWRTRQRVEQYQDTLLGNGHSGYLETCRRALVYCLRQHRIEVSDDDVLEFMNVWRELQPYEDALRGLEQMAGRYKLVALSNGDAWLLEHLVSENIRFAFDAVISVDEAGHFKPHPSVYRMAARRLGVEPSSAMMVAAHSFDIMGARASGYRGAYVNRYGLPTEDTPYQPDLEVTDFLELAASLEKSKSQ